MCWTLTTIPILTRACSLSWNSRILPENNFFLLYSDDCAFFSVVTHFHQLSKTMSTADTSEETTNSIHDGKEDEGQSSTFSFPWTKKPHPALSDLTSYIFSSFISRMCSMRLVFSTNLLTQVVAWDRAAFVH